MKVLVTGGTGFTGSHLVRRLLARGDEVRVLDNQEGLFHDELAALGADIRLGSVTDGDLVAACVDGREVVHHLAAAFRKLDVPDQHYRDVNVEGTRRLAEAALAAGVRRFVYCSTQGVHGHIQDVPGSESSPIAPEDYYQQTKYDGEVALQPLIERGLNAVTLRPTAIYGPGDPARFLMLFKMVAKGRFLMFGDGETFYHPVHIDNLVDAFLLAAEAGDDTTGETYLIGDADYWSLNDLVTHVAAAMNAEARIVHLPFWPLWLSSWACEMVCKPFRVSPPLFRRRANWFRQDRAFSIDKARRELGYEPRIGIREGLAETGAWYRENGYL